MDFAGGWPAAARRAGERKCASLDYRASGIGIGGGKLDRATWGGADDDAAGAGVKLSAVARLPSWSVITSAMTVVCPAATPKVTVW